MIEIIRPNWQPSQPVKKWGQIKEASQAMLEFIVLGKFIGLYKKAYSLCHSQVQQIDHYAFFVVDPEFTIGPDKLFAHVVIINPQILRVEEKSLERIDEACMSFPFRATKRVLRYLAIYVRYQVKAWYGLKTIEETCVGIKAQIFQHEVDHCLGRNIFEKYGEIYG